ncbi:MAG: response regulator, partial [Bacteroidota bacterium]
YNIINNAIKFTPSGKKVHFSIKHQADKQVTISVLDEGIGIPQKNLQDIFTRYTILSNRESTGTGIGLSLAYEITRLHGGELSVSSTEEEGSEFSIKLLPGKKHLENRNDVDFVKDKDVKEYHPITKDITEPQVYQTTTNNYNIDAPLALIVEDNTEILDYIGHALQNTFRTIKALNAKEGLEKLKECNPDIIITDIMMPGMNGLEFTAHLKNDFSTSHIPVVILTAKTDIEDQITGLEQGADAYVPKPFNAKLLNTVAHNLIDQRKRIISKFRDNKTIDPETLKVTNKDEQFLKDLVDYIKNNYTEEFSIEELAEKSYVSRTVFYNKIKGLTGMSPVEFVRQIKLKIAAQLLENGYNVSEVSYQIGFNDVKYFSRQFKKLFGHPPSKHKSELPQKEEGV